MCGRLNYIGLGSRGLALRQPNPAEKLVLNNYLWLCFNSLLVSFAAQPAMFLANDMHPCTLDLCCNIEEYPNHQILKPRIENRRQSSDF